MSRGTKNYNLYDPHEICNNHYVRVYYPWIHGACHWAKEDPWRYCCNSSRLKELVGFTVEWLVKQHEAAYRRAPAPAIAVATEASILVCDKGKRKTVDDMEEEKSCKFRADSLVEKSVMDIEAKRQQCVKRITRRQKDKKRIEDAEKEFHKLREKLQKEQELHK